MDKDEVHLSDINVETKRERTFTIQEPSFLERFKIADKNLGYWLIVIGSCILFLSMVTVETITVKYYNNEWRIILPWFTALLLSVGWPINWIPYLVNRKIPYIPKRLFLYYMGLGALDGVHLSLMSFGLNYLPGGTYIILKSTSLVFNVLLSRLLKTKKMNMYHYIAVALVMIASVFLGVGIKEDRQEWITETEYAVGFAFVLMSSLALGTHAMIGGYILNLMESETRQTTFYRVVEINAVTSFFSFLFVMFWIFMDYLFITDEISSWGSNFSRIRAMGVEPDFGVACFFVALTHQLGYTFKFAIVKHVSSVFADMLNSVRRVFLVLITTFLFDEYFGWNKGVSLVVAGIGLVVYAYAGRVATNSIENDDGTVDLPKIETKGIRNAYNLDYR